MNHRIVTKNNTVMKLPVLRCVEKLEN